MFASLSMSLCLCDSLFLTLSLCIPDADCASVCSLLLNVCMSVCACMYVCMSACMSVGMYVCVYVCMSVYVCLSACVSVFMYVCMYVHACLSVSIGMSVCVSACVYLSERLCLPSGSVQKSAHSNCVRDTYFSARSITELTANSLAFVLFDACLCVTLCVDVCLNTCVHVCACRLRIRWVLSDPSKDLKLRVFAIILAGKKRSQRKRLSITKG